MSRRAVGRPEEPLDPDAGPVEAFAHELRRLRAESGLTYREMVPLAHYSYTALQAAASGRTLPTWEVAKAFVTACGGDPAGLRTRWEAANAVTGQSADTPAGEPAEPSTGRPAEDRVEEPAEDPAELSPGTVVPPPSDPVAPPAAPATTRRRRLHTVATVAAAVLAIAAALVSWTGGGDSPRSGQATSSSTPPTTTQPSGPDPSSVPNGTTSTSTTPSPGTATTPATGTQDRNLSDTPTDQPTTTRTTTTTPGSPGNDEPKPGTEDPGRLEGVQEKRTVELVHQPSYNWVDIEYWRHDAGTPGELQIDTTSAFTAYGARLSVMPDNPLPNRARCSQVTQWRDRVRFDELHVGSQLCARSSVGRYASLDVRSLPSGTGTGRFIFYGITWY